ncbi:MAG: hypothetical protein ACMG6E_06565 [Candidatus Roizmanbacteria bacterium]
MITKLKADIPAHLENVLGEGKTNSVVITYFTRAFPRWIFNCLRKGKNPFTDLITSQDLLNNEDFDYFYIRNPRYKVKSDKLEWDWLDQRLAKIYAGPHFFSHSTSICVKISSKMVIIFDEVSNMSVALTKTQYDLCKQNFSCNLRNADKLKFLHECLYILLHRYKAIGIDNNHCSAPPSVIKYIRAQTELFGSPFNRTLGQFCSPFPDLEQYFGSVGSFFDFQIKTGTYFMNPPYDEALLSAAIQKVIAALQTSCQITVVIVIPLWDKSSQQLVRGVVHVDKEFDAYDLACNSGFLRGQVKLSYENHRFLNFYTSEYISVCDAHLLVLSNTTYQISAEMIAKEWANIQ